MSLYNILHGMNPLAGVILGTLDLTPDAVGRFRDCFVANGEIAIYTRIGGGNRRDYLEVFERLAEHPCYLRDVDDTFDCTYATIYFRFPERYAEFLAALDTGTFDPDQRWHDYFARMKEPGYVPPEGIQRLMDVIKEHLAPKSGGGS